MKTEKVSIFSRKNSNLLYTSITFYRFSHLKHKKLLLPHLEYSQKFLQGLSNMLYIELCEIYFCEIVTGEPSLKISRP